jgi:serine/threonine protein kinase
MSGAGSTSDTTRIDPDLASSGATTNPFHDGAARRGSSAAVPDEKSKVDAPPARIGRYHVLRRLGEGGMGVVYTAFDEELGRRVAVKLLHPDQKDDSELRARILREAQSLARVSAPNVVHVYEVGEVAGKLFIAMEFVDGQTLSQWQQEKRRSWQEILRMYSEAGQGLLDAHEAGLVHRDFKPDNVLIGADGRPRVADFGLARFQQANGTSELRPNEAAPARESAERPITQSDSAALRLLTQVGVVMGTPLYMSPEQHLGQAADSKSDQFSFCVALYEALYQQHPFPGSTVQALASATVLGRIRERPASTNVPAPVHHAILRGLARDPQQRFPSMRELLEVLALDPTRDPVTTPRALRWVALILPAFIVLSSVGFKMLIPLGISQESASILSATALCLFFAFVLLRFRSALRNPFHRTMGLTGMVWAGQLLVFRIVGLLLGLQMSQIVTLDLVALLAITSLYTALILPGLWPQIPVAAIVLLAAATHPDHAQQIAAVAAPAGMIGCIVAWSRKVGARSRKRDVKSGPGKTSGQGKAAHPPQPSRVISPH